MKNEVMEEKPKGLIVCECNNHSRFYRKGDYVVCYECSRKLLVKVNHEHSNRETGKDQIYKE